MSVRAPERPDVEVTAELEALVAEEELRDAPEQGSAPEEQPINVPLATAAIFLSTTAAGWMCAGIFRGSLAKVIAVLGAAIGTGIVGISYRTRRPSIVQYLALPVAIVAGALLVLPDAQGGSANLPGLISEAIRTGGVAQPPIPLDPGWRFIMVVLIAVVGSAAASLATGMNRPKVGIFIPVPLLFGAALLQPSDGGLVNIGIALVLFVAALAVSFGVELAQEGATSGRFETRRLLRGVGVVVLLVAVLGGLSRLDFLFPDVQRNEVVPPKRPEAQPPQKDRLLFTVQSERNLPWRLGVLDVYDGEAWLLPPYDTKRLKDVPDSGVVPGASAHTKTVSVTFTIDDIEGHVIPSVALPRSVKRDSFDVQFDPRTQMLRLPESRARKGMTYTVEAVEPPAAPALKKAGAPSAAFEEFLEVPPAPSDVQTIVAQAPTTNAFDRLQFVRDAFYKAVIAAGAGQPADVPPSRVADMLSGKEATPYEITAGEVLMARWAGIPARVGYGFYGGIKRGDSYEIRPKHGSTWLEAYFDGYGWVPIIGIPPKAKASLSQAQKNPDPQIRPTEDLALIVYVPIRRESIQLLYTSVRYWLGIVSPIVAGALLVWALFPGVVKIVRRWWRRRWARARGARERIAVAYAEFRDASYDLNVGDPAATALEFRSMIEPDEEHDELAWLVTRALWGDLGRDLRREDAEAAEDLARSVTKRLRRAQGGMTMLLAFGARASLRDPYSSEMPRLWPAWLGPGAVRCVFVRAARSLRSLKRLRRLIPIGATSVLLIALAASSSCAHEIQAAPGTSRVPERLVPAKLGKLAFKRERQVEGAFAKAGAKALVDEGRVFTVREDKDVHGYIEVASFRPGLGAGRKEVREGVLEGIATGRFEPTRLGRERVYLTRTSEQTFFLWFPPSGRYFSLLVARRDFADADRVFASVIAYQQGEKTPAMLKERRTNVIDPRRGGDL